MSCEKLTVAVAGATGLVGREMLSILEQRRFPVGELRPLASARSAGTRVAFGGRELTVGELTDDALAGADVVLLAVSGELARRYAPRARELGAVVIDNSSAFRMDDDTPLVVPELNGHVLDDRDGPVIVANPNCSTIIALMAVTPLHRVARVERMVVSTYQAASGGGLAMLEELEGQVEDHASGRPYRREVLDRPYLFNVFSHDSDIGPEGYNTEEMKLVRETHKIWADSTPAITATCVRVPVLRAHSEAINLTFERPIEESEVRQILARAPGVTVVDDRERNRFPEPVDASGGDDVLVGRGIELFVSGDQLRKGAALNAVQIAEHLVRRRGATEPPVTRAAAADPRG